MHKIKLVPDTPFYNRCSVDVYDVTKDKEKKRCRIKVEYSSADVRELKEKGMDKAAAMKYYKEWIYDVVKHYILDDWECTEGMDNIMAIVEEHIKESFKESEN